MCVTTSLSSALGQLGFVSQSAAASSVTAGCAAFGDGGDGYFSHAVIGIYYYFKKERKKKECEEGGEREREKEKVKEDERSEEWVLFHSLWRHLA